jgi:hypothetical protein
VYRVIYLVVLFSSLPYCTQIAVRKVFEDEVGMFPNLMTFVSRSDKLLRLTLVSKTFNKVVQLPKSWCTAEVSSDLQRDRFSLKNTPRIDTIHYANVRRPRQPGLFDDMPLYVKNLQKVRHLLVDIVPDDLLFVADKWRNTLETLTMTGYVTTTQEKLQLAIAAVRSMEHLRDVTLRVEDGTSDSTDWPNFKSIEKFTGYLTETRKDAIVAHGENLRYLSLQLLPAEPGEDAARIDAVMASIGGQLVLLQLENGWLNNRAVYADTEQILAAVANHSGRLKALRMDNIAVQKGNIDAVIRAVEANRLSLRALSIRVETDDIHVIDVDQLLTILSGICQGRLEYISVHIQTSRMLRGFDRVRYDELSGAAVRRFRFASVCFNGTRLIKPRYQVRVLEGCYNESKVMEMYANGLSPYPLRN